MRKQSFEWGYVEWVATLEGQVNIGISHIKVGGVQKEHIHYGNEQYIKVLKGSGRYTVNDREIILSEGDDVYFPANSKHATVNLGEDELVDLCVSTPISIKYDKINTFGNNSLKSAINFITNEVNLNSLNFPIIIFDAKGKIIYKNSLGSGFRDDELKEHYKLLTKSKDLKNNDIDGKMIISKSVYQGELMCTITSGYFPSVKNFTEDQIYKGSIESMMNISRDLGKIVETFLDFNSISSRLDNINKEIESKGKVIKDIEDRLDKKSSEVLDLKLGRNFLLNAINVLANEASENEKLYDMIVDLSYIIRYAEADKNDFEPIYYQVQFTRILASFYAKRYFKNFIFDASIDEDLEKVKVPSNIIMPLVENAILHGVSKKVKDKIVKINIKKDADGNLNIEVVNNGNKLDINSTKQINNYIKFGRGSLNIIYKKLKKYYGDDFKFFYESADNMTSAKIIIRGSYVFNWWRFTYKKDFGKIY